MVHHHLEWSKTKTKEHKTETLQEVQLLYCRMIYTLLGIKGFKPSYLQSICGCLIVIRSDQLSMVTAFLQLHHNV